ncbi:MAG: NAD-dependent epimerase/dehydratase family protein [Actinomycetota bacterium]|nr:NAD-dependent epimerase/dehydratase family protein [Actinomycetota bacterium]
MRAFLTGGTGFVGGRLAGALRNRGDEVVALVRSPAKAARLTALGCELHPGDLSDEAAIRAALEGCDAAFHVAAMYEVGIPRSARPAMYDANVRGTRRVLDAAWEAGVNRIVYVSTIAAFGNTGGKIVDETHRHPKDRFGSYYEETKALAHELALERIARGAPVIVGCPGGIYGPGDTSGLGQLIDRIRRGRLPVRMYPEAGFNWVHVDDVVAALLLAHDGGRIGETYVVGGQLGTIGDMIDAVAEFSGRRPPRWRVPGPLMKAGIPFGPLIGKAFGVGPNLGELIRSGENMTYWATDEKIRRELGYAPRDLRTGVQQMLAQAAS